MDEDEIERREQLAASTMEGVWELVRMTGGQWSPEAEEAYEVLRRRLCAGLGVSEEEVLRREG